jgi:NADH dehydrogenase
MNTVIETNKPPMKERRAKPRLHRIVIVGGGAGGLELATRLGDAMHKSGRAEVVLVDKSSTHLWKPLLHEVAAGSMDANAHQLEYAAQARWHHFEFQQGELTGLDRSRKIVTLSAVNDPEVGEVLPQRQIGYDTLVLAIGSTTNFFGTPGADEHALALDTVEEADRFRRRLIATCIRVQNHMREHPRHIDIVIIGGGATGVELSAELRSTADILRTYGVHRLDPRKDVRITLIEAGPRILGALPERLSHHTADLLAGLNIQIIANEKVTRVERDKVLTSSGKELPADMTVWAGGIQIPKVLGDVGLPTNKLGQVIVSQSLQTIVDSDIFAFGDCASCPWLGKGKTVPPRAQAAHQQAKFLYQALQRRLKGQALRAFQYYDYGSLVSLGRFDTVGNIMGKVVGSSIWVGGKLARLLYISLYRQHLMALHGFLRMAADTVGHWLRRKTEPRIKLH